MALLKNNGKPALLPLAVNVFITLLALAYLHRVGYAANAVLIAVLVLAVSALFWVVTCLPVGKRS